MPTIKTDSRTKNGITSDIHFVNIIEDSKHFEEFCNYNSCKNHHYIVYILLTIIAIIIIIFGYYYYK